MTSPTPYAPPKVAAAANKQGLLGFVRAMVNNPVGAVPRSAYREPIAVLSLPTTTLAFVTGPDLVEEILVRRPSDFPKSLVDDRMLRPALGNSLLTAEGDGWRWKRRLVAPYFTPAALGRHLPNMVAPFRSLAAEWHERHPGETLDVARAMTAATFEVISRVVFSEPNTSSLAPLADAIEDYLEPVSWVIGLASLRLPEWIPYPGRTRMRQACHRMRSVIEHLIAARREGTSAFVDICHDLMVAQDPETTRPLGDDDLVDMVLTLVAAGHETSAKGLTWALFCLAEQPTLQEEMAAEVARIVGARPIETTDLPALETVEAFIKESMRLFPPAPLMTRRTTRTEHIGGHDLKPGTVVFIPIYAIHRHEALWPNPDVFDHARFVRGNSGHIHRAAYIPFGAGPRSCLGATFAMMEMVAGLATLLQSLRFARPEGTHCEPIHRITLRPKNGLPLTVAPR